MASSPGGGVNKSLEYLRFSRVINRHKYGESRYFGAIQSRKP